MDFDNAELYEEYMALHPNVTIKENNIAQSANYDKALQTHLAANSGLDDIQALEIGFIADVVQDHADAFVDFAAEDNGDEPEGTETGADRSAVTGWGDRAGRRSAGRTHRARRTPRRSAWTRPVAAGADVELPLEPDFEHPRGIFGLKPRA